MRAETKVLGVLRNGPRYFSQLKEATKLSNSSLQNALKQLVSDGLLIKEETKAHAFYKVRATQQAALALAAFDARLFTQLADAVRIPLLEFLEVVPRAIATIILFGSAARGELKKRSDIDLLIVLHSFADKQLQHRYEQEVGKQIRSAQERAEALSLHPFSIALVRADEYRNTTDYLVVQAKTTGFPILHHTFFYEERFRSWP